LKLRTMYRSEAPYSDSQNRSNVLDFLTHLLITQQVVNLLGHAYII
jgi:hypothetical protein